MENVPPLISKVRVVRCPRCTSLLPEPTDVPFYVCGGCGALLQATHYKKESERQTTSDCSSFAQRDEGECGHDGEGEAGSSSTKRISNPRHSQEHNEGIDQDAAQNGILEQVVLSRSSEEVSLSTEVNSRNEVDPQLVSARAEEESSEARNGNSSFVLRVKEHASAASTSPTSVTDTQKSYLVDAPKKAIDSVTDTLPRGLHKSLMRNFSAYDGSVNSYEKKDDHAIENETNDAEDSKSEESRKVSTGASHHLLGQRTPPMLNVIETSQGMRRDLNGRIMMMQPRTEEFLPRTSSYPGQQRQRPCLSSLDYQIHFQPYRANVDNRLFPLRPCPYYGPSREIYYPHLSYRRCCVYDPSWEFVDTYTASPHVFSDSEYYTWGYGKTCEDQRQRDQDHSRRNPKPKRHIRPMAGATPFVTCYQCLELLEMPLDFLLFKRRRGSHRVKCSSCSSILEFALENGYQLVPYTPPPGPFESVETRQTQG